MSEVSQLYASIRDIAPTLREGICASDANGYLSDASVRALHESGLYKLWWPKEVGGPGLTLLEAVQVVEAVAAVDTTAAWNLAIGTIHSGFAGAYLEDHALEQVFREDPVIAGQLAPIGTAEPAEGGIRVSGQWSFGSGMRQSNWVLGGAMLKERESPPAPVVFIAPKSQASVDENSWQVAGLSGTGSCDYSIESQIVPDGFWFSFPAPERRRGSDDYQLSMVAQSAILHAAIPLGAAQHALDEIIEIARQKKRSFAENTIAHRETFQTALARHHATLAGARLYLYDAVERLSAAADESTVLLEMRAATRHVTDVAVDIAEWAYRSAGGSAMRLSSPLQHILRDLLGATQHIYVDEAAVTAFGAQLVGEEA